jgi:hypothetical protein
MKKIILTLIFGGAVSFAVDAQSIERSVIGSAGGVSTTASSIITWTVGETVVNTAGAGSVILTQGFQQPEISTGAVKTLKSDAGMKVYPNPSSGKFTLEKTESAPSNVRQVSIAVYDAAGKLVYVSGNLDISSGTYNIDLSNLPGGFYSMNVDSVTASSTYKLTIVK